MIQFIKTKQRGQILIVITMALVGILGIAGLVIDGGNVLLDRRNAQNAADSSALAGAIIRVSSQGEDWVGTIMTAAAENGYANDGVKSTVEVYSPPKSGPYANNVEYFQVIITSHVRMYFAVVIGRRETTNVVEAVVRTKPAVLKPLLDEAAMASLAQTSNCDKERAFWVHEEGTFEVSGGHVFINSSNKTCALIQEGGGSIYMRYNDPINVVGGVSIQNPRRISPVVAVGVAQISYPPPFIMPDIKCNRQAKIEDDGETMSAGSWGGKFPPPNVKKLKPGVYCLENGFIANNGTELFGSEVLIKVEKGEVSISDEAIVSLSAPAKGKFMGLLIFLPMDNNKRVVLNQHAQSEFTGTILAPASNILFKRSESRYGFFSQIIGYRIALSGDSNIRINYDPDQNYKALSNSEIQLIK
jgi:Flp pilus assembly protein TadG